MSATPSDLIHLLKCSHALIHKRMTHSSLSRPIALHWTQRLGDVCVVVVAGLTYSPQGGPISISHRRGWYGSSSSWRRTWSPIAVASRAISSGDNGRWPARKLDQRSSTSASLIACSRFASAGSRVPKLKRSSRFPIRLRRSSGTTSGTNSNRCWDAPGTSHRKSHVHHPCVPISGGKAYANQ